MQLVGRLLGLENAPPNGEIVEVKRGKEADGTEYLVALVDYGILGIRKYQRPLGELLIQPEPEPVEDEPEPEPEEIPARRRTSRTKRAVPKAAPNAAPKKAAD